MLAFRSRAGRPPDLRQFSLAIVEKQDRNVTSVGQRDFALFVVDETDENGCKMSIGIDADFFRSHFENLPRPITNGRIGANLCSEGQP